MDLDRCLRHLAGTELHPMCGKTQPAARGLLAGPSFMAMRGFQRGDSLATGLLPAAIALSNQIGRDPMAGLDQSALACWRDIRNRPR